MACSSCGKKLSAANFGATAQGQAVNLRTQQKYYEADPSKWVEVTFQGAIGNHFIASPTRKIRHYGYGGRGAVFMAHVDDVLNSPAVFVPTTIDGALAVWPSYPAGAPAHIVMALGLPPKVSVTAQPDPNEPGTPTEEAPAATDTAVVVDTAVSPTKKKKG